MAKKGLGAGEIVGAVIGVSIGIVVAMVTLPIALAEAADAEAANWGTAGIALLGLFGLVAAAGLLFYLLRGFGVVK